MKDASSRRRNLYIRTYSAIPLNEANGLVEWVDNTKPLRDILWKYYDQPFREKMRAIQTKFSKQLPDVNVFKNQFLPLTQPPQFHKFFLGKKKKKQTNMKCMVFFNCVFRKQ